MIRLFRCCSTSQNSVVPYVSNADAFEGENRYKPYNTSAKVSSVVKKVRFNETLTVIISRTHYPKFNCSLLDKEQFCEDIYDHFIQLKRKTNLTDFPANYRDGFKEAVDLLKEVLKEEEILTVKDLTSRWIKSINTQPVGLSLEALIDHLFDDDSPWLWSAEGAVRYLNNKCEQKEEIEILSSAFADLEGKEGEENLLSQVRSPSELRDVLKQVLENSYRQEIEVLAELDQMRLSLKQKMPFLIEKGFKDPNFREDIQKWLTAFITNKALSLNEDLATVR